MSSAHIETLRFRHHAQFTGHRPLQPSEYTHGRKLASRGAQASKQNEQKRPISISLRLSPTLDISQLSASPSIICLPHHLSFVCLTIYHLSASPSCLVSVSLLLTRAHQLAHSPCCPCSPVLCRANTKSNVRPRTAAVRSTQAKPADGKRRPVSARPATARASGARKGDCNASLSLCLSLSTCLLPLRSLREETDGEAERLTGQETASRETERQTGRTTCLLSVSERLFLYTSLPLGLCLSTCL